MASWSLSTLPEAALLMYYHAQISVFKILLYQKFINKNILNQHSCKLDLSGSESE